MEGLEQIFTRRFEFDPLYTVAIIKVSNELRPEPLKYMEEILEDTLTDLNIDPVDLDDYVSRNRDSLVETCRRIGI